MNIYSVVFSNNRNYRFTRHAIFWLMWITYYTIFDVIHFKPSYPLSDRFFCSFLEVAISTPMDMVFCYAIIYFLLPRFLLKGRYLSMILLWFLFSILFITVYETYVLEVIPFIREWYNLPDPVKPASYYWIFFSLFGQINMEGCMAAAIKLGKLAFIKQQEVELLRNEKNRLPAQLDKDEMQSVFLVDIIGRVEQTARQKPTAIPGMIKKIRNLMTYIIYENKKTKVDLRKELELIKEYVELEKCTRNDVIDVNLFISGYTESESIATFILFPCIQNAFKQVSILNVENKKITIDINVNNSILDLKISWNKPLDTSTLAEGKNIILQNISKRLNLIYPQSHEMKVIITVDEIIVTLNIDLKTAVN
ncbi:MAG: histidine kinase [Ginsengibacter sp.]